MTPPRDSGVTVWVVYHRSVEDAIAVFSSLEKAEAAYPGVGLEFVRYQVDPDRILNLADRR